MAGTRSKKQKKATEANHDSARKNNATKPWWFNEPEPIDRFTGWLVFFAFWAVVIAALQWCTLQSTNEIALNANRPHLLLSELKVSGLKPQPEGQQEIVLSTYFKFGNYGNAPAKVYKWCANLHAGELPTEPLYRPCNDALRVLAPKQAFDSAKPFTKTIDNLTATRILSGESGLFFFGIIDYGDAMDTPHRARFCYQLDFAGGGSSARFYVSCPSAYWEYN